MSENDDLTNIFGKPADSIEVKRPEAVKQLYSAKSKAKWIGGIAAATILAGASLLTNAAPAKFVERGAVAAYEQLIDHLPSTAPDTETPDGTPIANSELTQTPQPQQPSNVLIDGKE